MSARKARCAYFKTCGSEKPSADALNLAFFKAMGEGSPAASVSCVTCRYSDIAHDDNAPHYWRNGVKTGKTVVERGLCDGFKPHGAFDHDEYYCGCRGWD